MTTGTNFIESAKKNLQALGLKPVAIEPGLKRIEVPGGTIDLEVFEGDKIEKVVFSSIKVHEMSVAEESVIIWPADYYDIPVLWCNLTAMPGMNVSILDFIPLMDIVVWPDYAERYLALLPEIKEETLEILKETITEKDFPLSSIVGWTMSPYRTLLKLTDEGIPKIPAVLSLYCNAYAELLRKAVPSTYAEDRKFSKRKKEGVRKLMKENDPGYPIMLSIFGEENTGKVFDIVF